MPENGLKNAAGTRNFGPAKRVASDSPRGGWQRHPDVRSASAWPSGASAEKAGNKRHKKLALHSRTTDGRGDGGSIAGRARSARLIRGVRGEPTVSPAGYRGRAPIVSSSPLGERLPHFLLSPSLFQERLCEGGRPCEVGSRTTDGRGDGGSSAATPPGALASSRAPAAASCGSRETVRPVRP
jgi:hypothetical protein